LDATAFRHYSSDACGLLGATAASDFGAASVTAASDFGATSATAASD
jgi:hypothetical protein